MIYRKLIIEVDLEIVGELPADAEARLREMACINCGGLWLWSESPFAEARADSISISLE